MPSLPGASPLAEHQLAAVEALLPRLSAYGGAILADEPGLGKSFVAAEVARRAQSEGLAIETVIPASLVGQWTETLRAFGVHATVMTHSGLMTAPASHERRLVIVDEAHAFRNPKTQRYAALARRSIAARLLLVTATPVCNGAADLEALLRLIVHDDVLMHLGVPSIDAAFSRRDHEAIEIIVSELLIRRDRSVLPPALAFGELERRIVWSAGNEMIESLIAALEFPLVEGTPLVRDFLLRRLESSEAAILESLRRQRRFYERVLESLAAGRALPKRDYRRAFAHEEDAASFQTVLFWELFVPDPVTIAPDLIHEAIARLESLHAAIEAGPREKERRLLDLCASMTEPLLIFTGWTATALRLLEVLGGERRVVLVTGRERGNATSIESFRCGAADVLVSTDVGAEGLNLQRAGVVIHYDLPWNPVRIDQRNGRAHRIGQQRGRIRAIYFLPDRHRGRVLQTVTAKNRTRRRLLRVTPVDAPEVRRPTIRPRVTVSAAIVRFVQAARAAGLAVPEVLERRHRAGIEAVLESGEAGAVERLLALPTAAGGHPYNRVRGPAHPR